MASINLSSLFRLDITDDYCSVVCARPFNVLSSAIVNGGWQVAPCWLNMRVNDRARGDLLRPADTLDTIARHVGLPLPCIGMMTAASMGSCRMRFVRHDGEDILCVATTGTANARRAGDPCDADDWNDHVWRPGTINIALFTSLRLTTAAMVEALQLLAEAKTAACHDNDLASPVTGFIATGTGTDASAVFSDPEGRPVEFCGKHLKLGELIGGMAYDVVAQGIQACYRAQRKEAT